MSAINPDHYQFGAAQVIDITEHLSFLVATWAAVIW